jgi:uncharacterized phage protein (TIGR01671 family)
MRDIKFRAWLKNENVMGEVTGFRFSKSQYPFASVRFRENGKIVDDGYHFGQEDGCDNVILMQFTGCHDKNGKEIYEVDIVLYDRNIHKDIDTAKFKVVWAKDRYVLQEIKHKYYIDDVTWELVEVIGNIYENPELLTENVQ